MKLLLIAVVALGALGAFVFFILWAVNGLPYQDPTPEMLQAQDLRGLLYGAGMVLSVLAAWIGGRFLWLRRRRGRTVT